MGREWETEGTRGNLRRGVHTKVRKGRRTRGDGENEPGDVSSGEVKVRVLSTLLLKRLGI